MARRSPKFRVGQRVEHAGEPVTVVENYQGQPAGTVNVRDRYGYVHNVKAKDVKERP